MQINEKCLELNVSNVSGKTGAKEYEVPILVSLLQLGKDYYWSPKKIIDNWRKRKYVTLTPEDEGFQDIPSMDRLTYINMHAFALVSLSKNGYIKKHDEKTKEYQITGKGINYLRTKGVIGKEPHNNLEQKSSTVSKSDIASAFFSKKQIILYGPPGTGKTYNSRKNAVDIVMSARNV